MGFILSVSTQENIKQQGKTKHSQKVQKPQKDILKMFFCIKWCMILWNTSSAFLPSLPYPNWIMFFLREYVEGFWALTLKFLQILQAGSKHLTPTASQPLIGTLTFKEKSSLSGPIQQVAFKQ